MKSPPTQDINIFKRVWLFCIFCCSAAAFDTSTSYLEKIEKNDDPEECWLARYQLAEMYEETLRWDEAMYWYLEAFQFDSSREEPLQKIATHYRLKGDNDLAYLFAQYGSRLSFKSPHFEEELSIVSFYTPFKESGYHAASNLLLRKNIPYSIRDQTYKNLLFYIEPLPNTAFQRIDFAIPDQWRAMNPSIVKTENGYAAICRVVNYVQKGAKHFQTNDPDGIFRSRNFILKYDVDFHLVSEQEIADPSRIQYSTPSVQGLEDCRLFQWKNSLWFSCTTTDTNPTGSYQISLCKLAGNCFGSTALVDSLLPLEGPDPYRCEKNWLPFIHGDHLFLIYSYDPFMIYTPDLQTGASLFAFSYAPKYDFSSFRGSAAPIPFEDGFLALIHEVVFLPNGERVYLHRFLFLDCNFEVNKISKPFIFKEQGVEFCNGMCWDHSGKKIILAIGIEDREAWFCAIKSDAIEPMLSFLPL